MKKICYALFCILFPNILFASNYYWVGGTGNWSDYATHWATASGGVIFHIQTPTPSDDVYFDSNSFSVNGDSVYLDTTIVNCHTMDWSGTTNAPVLFSARMNLNLYGSLILNNNMTWTTDGSLVFQSTTTGNLINTEGTVLNISIGQLNVYFNGTGSWDLQNGLNVGSANFDQANLWLTGGNLITHGYTVTCDGDFNIGGILPVSCLLDTSLITCNNWKVNSVYPILLDADSAIIQCHTFLGGINHTYNMIFCGDIGQTDSCHFQDVQCDDQIAGNANVFHNVTMGAGYNSIEGNGNNFNKLIMPSSSCNWNGSNSVDTMIFNNPGQQISMTDGSMITINGMITADGSCSGLTSIQASSGTATINKSSGTATFNYVLLQNITATGGANFIANNSVNAGNVTGITINSPSPQTLYWVGGTGNWNDVNHWATSSGGTGGSCVPTQFDDVNFDANSFSSISDTVYVNNNLTIYCHTMDWSGTTNAPVLFSARMNLNLYGSLILNNNMIWTTDGSLVFQSTTTGNLINTEGTVLNISIGQLNVYFNGTGSWDLQNGLNVGSANFDQANLWLTGGNLITHGYTVTCDGDFNIGGILPVSCLLDTSLITCNNWKVNSVYPILLDADSAIIQCHTFLGGINHTYNMIFCGDIGQTDSCHFQDVQCDDQIAGNANVFHNVTMGAGYNSIEGNGNNFNKLIMPSSSCNWNGSNSVDTMIFNNPGQQISMTDGSMITINGMITADGSCSGLTSIQASSGTATINKSSGTATFNYVLLQNITATGGANFIANNSVNAGNVTGITINSPSPQTLYWVGGTGNWNDVNHWATSSGGTGGSCVPTQFDDVNFDANSFSSISDTVYVNNNLTIYCHTMDWSGTTNAPVLFSARMNLNLYGSLILNNNMIWTTDGSLVFQSTTTGNLINTEGTVLNISIGQLNVYFNGTGSWDLQNGLNVGSANFDQANLWLTGGNLITHGYTVTCDGDFNIGGILPVSCLLDTSLITCNNWKVNSVYPILLDADSAIIQCHTFLGGINHTYNMIFCGDIGQTDSCHFQDVQCDDQIAGNANVFHNVTMGAGYNSIEGNGNNFNKLIMPSSSCNWNGSNSVDTMIFNNPGQQISMTDGSMITINGMMLLQSDPGFPTLIQSNSGQATIAKPTDTVCLDFVYLYNIIATGGAQFFAGVHSVDLGNNSGWIWTNCTPDTVDVWPGDANSDLVANNLDILNIGVAYGDTGFVRQGATLSYTAQPCLNWYYQFLNGANVNNADCDGNGIVDASDTTAVSLNYGQVHPPRLAYQNQTTSFGPDLEFQLPATITQGTVVSVPIIFGTTVNPANNVYGIAFTINYDSTSVLAGSMSVDYTGSWIESAGNHLHLEKNFPSANKLDLAFTRINHTDVSGNGLIATLNFTVSSSAGGFFYLSFSGVKVISHNEIEIPVQSHVDSTITLPSGIQVIGVETESSVYPNPMRDATHVYFINTNHEKYLFSLSDAEGREAAPEKIIFTGDVFVERKNLSSGVYFYSLKNSDGTKTARGKIVVE